MRVRSIVVAVLCLALLGAASAHASSVDEFYALRGKERKGFDRGAARMEPNEARALEHLFDLTDHLMVANMRVILWFRSYGDSGLHLEDYLEQHEALQRDVERLLAESPLRMRPMLAGIAGALPGQRAFFSDWGRAVDERRPFESPLDDEYAHHEALYRSHRALLRVYSELLALYPEEGADNRRSFFSHLCALDLI